MATHFGSNSCPQWNIFIKTAISVSVMNQHSEISLKPDRSGAAAQSAFGFSVASMKNPVRHLAKASPFRLGNLLQTAAMLLALTSCGGGGGGGPSSTNSATGNTATQSLPSQQQACSDALSPASAPPIQQASTLPQLFVVPYLAHVMPGGTPLEANLRLSTNDTLKSPPTLSVGTLPPGFSVAFATNSSPANTAPGQTDDLGKYHYHMRMTVTAAASVSPGTYTIPVKATYKSGTLSANLVVQAVQCINFAHPGVILNKTQISFIQKQVTNGVWPWAHTGVYGAYDRLQSYVPSPASAYVATPQAFVPDGVNQNVPSQFQADAIMAHSMALWAMISGDTSYFQQAAATMDAWAGASGFGTWLTNRFKPFLGYRVNGTQGGNMHQTAFEAMVNVGVYTNDVDLFLRGINGWRVNLPAYAYDPGDGRLPSPPVAWDATALMMVRATKPTCTYTGTTQSHLPEQTCLPG
jgi:hypothetical protein